MKKRAVIVLPTYNEKENICNLLLEIFRQQDHIDTHELHVLVVDDSSPDGTATIVRRLSKINSNIHLLSGKKQGLGIAYIRGFRYATQVLKADIIFEMDADFSHDPYEIPRFIYAINNGANFIIGSRYVKNGSIPANWPILRKMNSKFGNILGRYIAGLYKVKDCTGGFRAIKTSLLNKIKLTDLRTKGYAFQISLLHQAIKKKAIIQELPIDFKDRVHGESKIRFKDITEFIGCAILLRLPFLRFAPVALMFFMLGLATGGLAIFLKIDNHTQMIILSTLISGLLTLQGAFTIYWMMYAWENPKEIEKNKSPKYYERPRVSFTALIPARKEEHVIQDTIQAIARIDYPENLKETLIICRSDDMPTIIKAQQMINELGRSNIRLVVFNDLPINKPHSLNVGMRNATKDVVVVFDAEDEPHKHIYHIANTLMIREKSDVIQSGVQLMNFRSNWFSALNVLEYFFWFKSALHLFSRIGTVPLGGNTVFFKRRILNRIGGWNESFLTEDADIGMRLSSIGAKMRIVYDEAHVTKEETPTTLSDFIRQRTRWNQGFLQVFLDQEWLGLNNTTQKLVSIYILLWPFLQALLLLYIPFSIISALSLKLPIIVTLLSSLPVYLLVIQMIISIIGMYEFTKGYKLKFPFYMPLVILVTFYPYQILLGVSSLRAIIRLITNKYSWEKTLHMNAHRGGALAR